MNRLLKKTSREHKLKPHQIELAKKVEQLYSSNLYYLVTKPHRQFKNHTINEIKMHFTEALEKYSRDYLLHRYKKGDENSLFKYVMFIEYPKEFYQAISVVDADLFSMYKGVHFHLFISSKDKYANIPQLIYYIFSELSSQKIKERSILEYDYYRFDREPEKRFLEYHTKQHYHYLDKNRLLINI